MSGESDSMIAHMQGESRDLRLKVSSLEEGLMLKEREKDTLMRRIAGLEEEVSDPKMMFGCKLSS